MSKKIPLIKASRANRPRNAFDLSQKHLFTAHAGMLLPVMTLDLIPHDHVSIQATDFMRCLPMNSAAFMSMRSVYEFFFVPYSQLWHPFDQFITGMNDYRSVLQSDLYKSKSPLVIPSFKRKELYELFNAPGGFLNQQSNQPDIFGFKSRFNFLRLLDLLGYGVYVNADGSSRIDAFSKLLDDTEKLSIFRLAAYQKIYSDFYRNTTYEAVDVSSFSLDNITDSISAINAFKRFGTLRYRNAQLDYFTNLRPTPLFDLDNPSLNSFYNTPGNADSVSIDSDSNAVNFQLDSDLLTVQSIRNAFALDKLMRITQRAGKTYAEQIKAHFGFEVSEGRDGRVNYIGGFDSNIQVGDVTQMSGTTASPEQGVSIKHGGYLGRVTGKAQGSGSGHIEFDAHEHGILMCIYSLVPDMQYDATRIDPFVTKLSRGDFFMPEFEDLGMQPLQTRYISDIRTQTEKFKGWQPRYSEYKTSLDINHGQFANGQPLSYWTVGRGRAGETLETFDIASLKINPKWLDSIFAVNYNGTQITDCVFGGCQFNVQKVSDMSENGEPRI
ncbi:putative capsid protein (F protein) [Hoylesella buccalis ATCC 35310]|uniref:Putative capsid protein (F protein) n=1 Tax=Hoylesella buccalis ATCC 35310 TaxID=679190 RepID=D1W386_9BACT|nr:major capsid protein [Hoylesella buccalis]EFA93043.1 putative capsid protein (F protein) [Hoylesella buccalis ATCC 35310]